MSEILSPTFYLVLYSLLWLVSLVVYKIQFRGTNLGAGLLVFWFFSSIASIWMIGQGYYYSSGLYRFDIVSFTPLLYLWIVVMMFAGPILIAKAPPSSYLLFCTQSNEQAKKAIASMLILSFVLLSLVKLYCVLKLPNAFDFFSATTGSFSKREHQAELNEAIFSSKMGIYSNKITDIFRDSMLCFAFYYVVAKKKFKATILFLCCVGLPFYEAVVFGNRQKIICLLITIFITYELFKQFLDGNLRRRIRIFFCVFVLVCMFPVFLISILRFGDYADFLVYEMIRYFGESSVNFASWLFPHLQGQDNGKIIMSTLFRDLSFYQKIYTIGPYFYTFVGSIIMAWGRLFAFFAGLFFLLFSLKHVQNLQSRKMSLGKAIALQTVAIMCYEGLFSFIHWLAFGAFIAGFLWLLILDSNWLYTIQRIWEKIISLEPSIFIKTRGKHA